MIGISLYLQGTLGTTKEQAQSIRYIPVPTGNSRSTPHLKVTPTVYPCTYRELSVITISISSFPGISLYLQGTLWYWSSRSDNRRYIPVPTGNSDVIDVFFFRLWVYPCTYRELSNRLDVKKLFSGISLYLQGTQLKEDERYTKKRYIPVPTGNSLHTKELETIKAVYPCTYRELPHSY